MSTIYFITFVLYLASAISAIPSPAVIYSATIYNSQYSDVRCSVAWLQPNDNKLDHDRFTVEQNNYYQVEEKPYNMGTWKARGIIEKIQCGDKVLSAPFKNVHSPTVNLKFCIQLDGTISVGSC